MKELGGEENLDAVASSLPIMKRLIQWIRATRSRLLSLNLEPVYRYMARTVMRTVYHIEYRGFDKIPKEGPALIIGNHVSYADGLIIQAGCKRPIRFVIDKFIYQAPGVHYFMKYNRAIPIAPTKEDVSHALDMISEALESGDLVFIFPEGQLTYSGHLGHFKPGIEWIIARDPVPVYPIALEGMWGSLFSRKYRKSRLRYFKHFVLRRRVTATCVDPLPPEEAKAYNLQRIILKLLHQKTRPD